MGFAHQSSKKTCNENANDYHRVLMFVEAHHVFPLMKGILMKNNLKRHRCIGLLALLSSALLLPSMASADEACELSISGNDAMQFDQQSMTVPSSCESVTVTLEHTGQLASNIMGHNWVLVETANLQTVGNAGMAAGLDNNYLPADDPRILAATKVVGGGESDSVTFSLAGLKGKDLSFFCSFPGHVALMKGKFTIE